MKVFGIVASRRRLGNSEILVKEALLRAKEMGAEVEAIRLTDYEVKVCKACYACLWDECRIEDDVNWIFDKMAEADGVILGTPVYILMVPGILKMLTDRVLSQFARVKRYFGKPAGVIVTAGKEGWEALGMPTASIFLNTMGFRIVYRFLAYGRGPGEVLLNPENVRKARELGEVLVRSARGEEVEVELEGCPICGATFYEVVEGGRVRCPICRIEGKLVEEKGGFKPIYDREEVEKRRKPEFYLEHADWLRWTKEKYEEMMEEIKKLRRKYEEFDPFIRKRG